ncbi:hypothetical protein QTI17_12025 [Variovorax sp. J31P179]|uniref:hypothetical protein n=1 Tax=Variovorax sp. J31P179 TaxID=3053508 RepID=UPI0025783EC1|nr:hypothetical protein [Variovorax sp. J31P179]MDM0081324.1 hypothetical protein [Variovorax sp. J31P179]
MEATLTSSRTGNSSGIKWLRWVILMVVVAACYAPGLQGSFVFDDDVNILQNQHLRISSMQWTDLWAAASSGSAGPLGRPVSLVSFALNLLLWGSDPYYFKLVNLLIHLGNALLIGALAQSLVGALSSRDLPPKDGDAVDGWSGWMVAALWALHPINLTGVLYVVQRMTSLSTFFGLCALLVFAKYRERTFASADLGNPGFAAMVAVPAVLSLLALSALAKESGLLFAPLLLWIEYFAYGFRFNRKPLRLLGVEVRHIASALIAATCIYAVFFKIPSMIMPAAFSNRDFDARERSLTEARAIFYYLRLILFPRNSELSLYHDDFVISRSLWDPVTTVLSVAGLLAISAVSLVLRRRFPALLFAWGWFLIAHALESTVFPLELVHEHRNYFATIGLFMLLPMALAHVSKMELKRLFVVLFAGYLALIGFITHVRALQWSNTVDWAALEASNHPASARANYELARNYMILMHNTEEKRFGDLADQALLRATESYLPGVLPFMARIQFAYFRDRQPDPSMIERVKFGLRNWPFYTVNTATLGAFVTCQIEKKCRMADEQALDILDTALENPRIRKSDVAEIKKLQAQYYINRFDDLKKGTDLISESIQINEDPGSRIMFAQALAMQGKFKAALAQMDIAEALDKNFIYRQQIAHERDAMRQAQQR